MQLAAQLCKLPLVPSHSHLHPQRHLTVLGCVKSSMSFTSSARSPATLRTISHLQGEGPAGQGQDERWLCAQPAMLAQLRGNSRCSNRRAGAGNRSCMQQPALCFAAALPPVPSSSQVVLGEGVGDPEGHVLVAGRVLAIRLEPGGRRWWKQRGANQWAGQTLDGPQAAWVAKPSYRETTPAALPLPPPPPPPLTWR